MKHIGIDPGLSGAIAVLTDDTLQIHDMPVMTVDRNGKAKRQVSANELAELLNLYAVECERDYYRDLVPERDKSGRFIKKENIDA